MSDLLTGADDMTPERLTALLQTADVLPQGRVREVEREPAPAPNAHIVHLTLAYTPDAPADAPRRLVAKLPRPDRNYTDYDAVRPSEAHFYQHLAPLIGGPPLVRCYAHAFDAAQGRGHLLLEDVSATHSVPPFPDAWPLPPSYTMLEAIVDALVACQAPCWDHPALATLPGGYPTGASSSLATQKGVQAYPQFAEALGDRLSPSVRELYARVLAAYPTLDRRFASRQHLTIAHGDFLLGNVLLPNDPARDTVRILDWEICSVNLGTFDLAEILSLHWDGGIASERERVLVERYHAGLLARGVSAYSWEQCWEDYRLALLNHLFTPVQQWADQHWPGFWWGRFERTVKRVRDLGCEELLGPEVA
jgi:hypothetical protein